ncbi:hypothetical protein [Acidipila rosea]|uniref:DUF4405 domain-containing protein n=1 Tax=Acidipila rosea TaxID=768535 RepID=A0A4R1KYX3_9BACT|nr:hypothetical protein [Acidipila rosea]TCK70748.1 hypothetical protein C7378_3136 [Acidipila rosea]
MSASVGNSGGLGRSRRWGLYIIGIGAWLSGGLWLLFHYFFVEQGEFGPQVNPLEPWWLKIHGAFAFAATWIFGLMWGVHVTKAWPYKRRRSSGAMLTAVFAWLTLSGFLLYYVGDERIRPMLSIGHWAIGIAFPLAFGWHRLKR